MTTRPDARNPIGHARAHELELDLTARELVFDGQRRAARRIRDALAADALEHVRQLLSTSAHWLPWQPIEQARFRRRLALRQLASDLGLLGALLGVVWLVFAVWQAWH